MKRILFASLLVLAVACGDHEEEPAEAGTKSDEAAVTMPAEAAKQNDIMVAALQPASTTIDVSIGNATVVDVTDLLNSVSQYAGAAAQREQAMARLQASRAELERLRILNADDKNVSDRAVQEAAANARSDEAAVRSADAAAMAAQTAARQRWGSALASAVIGGAAWARQLSSRETVLLEAAFTADVAPPARIRVMNAMRRPVEARYLATSPRVDARLQKPVYQYLAPAAELPVGFVTTISGTPSSGRGVFVPIEAVVWNGAQALVFVEDRPGHYVQHPVDTRNTAPGGFIDASLQAGTRVVVRGAQQLLSEQHKPEVE